VRAGRHEDGLELLESAVAQLKVHGMEDAVVAQTYLAEALAWAGRGVAAIELIDRLEQAAGSRAAPLLLRARALAAQRPNEVLDGLRTALRAARDESCDHDAAITLDLLISLAGEDPEAGSWKLERDRLFVQLGIVALPRVPFGRS
jgi:hypothetical protein